LNLCVPQNLNVCLERSIPNVFERISPVPIPTQSKPLHSVLIPSPRERLGMERRSTNAAMSVTIDRKDAHTKSDARRPNDCIRQRDGSRAARNGASIAQCLVAIVDICLSPAAEKSQHRSIHTRNARTPASHSSSRPTISPFVPRDAGNFKSKEIPIEDLTSCRSSDFAAHPRRTRRSEF
jgi:hypothetical protein